jgi:hypothetical protein
LDTSRGAVAESLGRRDVVLGQGWQVKMTCDGTHSRNGEVYEVARWRRASNTQMSATL